MSRRLFCELGPNAYKISLKKEELKRNFKDMISTERIAKDFSKDELEYTIKSHTSLLLRKLHGVDMQLQENKVTNIELACKQINGIIIHPGETFSYWTTVGKPTAKKGYKAGLTVSTKMGLNSDIGGGLLFG